MLLERLELSDFRSYGRLRIDLDPGPVVFTGANAQGKTNLLEAIHRVATGSSHRVASDATLVRSGATTGVIRAEARTDDGRRRTIELEVGTDRRTRMRVDGADVRRVADLVGVLRVVMFAPEDLRIVRGDPAERRRFLDTLLAQRRPAFATARAEYDRALRQRNRMLRQLKSMGSSARDSARSTIEVWTEQLVKHGTQVTAARIAAVRGLRGPADEFYRELADRPEHVGMEYRSAVPLDAAGRPGDPVPDPEPISRALRAAFEDAYDEEIARGTTLVGPHRDDLELAIGPLPARGYASHGEAWSLTLALVLAAYDVLAEVGDRPILLLDDVFAELDEKRRQRLAAACDRFDQVLVTAAVDADVPLDGPRVRVRLEDGVSTAERVDRNGASP